jgi:hypothetical protein
MIVNQCPEHTFKARIESIGRALVKYRSNTGQKPAKHWSGSCCQNTALVLRGSPEGSLVKTLVINRSCWSNTGHAGQTPGMLVKHRSSETPSFEDRWLSACSLVKTLIINRLCWSNTDQTGLVKHRSSETPSSEDRWLSWCSKHRVKSGQSHWSKHRSESSQSHWSKHRSKSGQNRFTGQPSILEGLACGDSLTSA